MAGTLETLRRLNSNGVLSKENSYLIPLLELYIYCHVAIVETLSYIRAYERTKSIIERNVCLGFIDIVVGEGYTYLCGGAPKSKDKKLSKIVNALPDCEPKAKLQSLFRDFFALVDEYSLFDGLKEDKDMAKHYDSDYLKIAHNINKKLDVNRSMRDNVFVTFLSEISNNITDYFNQKQIVIQVNNNVFEINQQHELTFKTMLLDDDIGILYGKIEEDENTLMGLVEIVKCTQKLQDIHCRGIVSPECMENISRDIQKFMHLTSPIWHIRKVRLDIKYAMKAYFESTEHLERQANAYRMMMALYGGYTQLCNIKGQQTEKPLMSFLHKAVSDCRNDKLSANELSVKRGLSEFEEVVLKYESARGAMTHCREKRIDKILEKYEYLCTISPSEILDDCYDFIRITYPLIEITDTILRYNYPDT